MSRTHAETMATPRRSSWGWGSAGLALGLVVAAAVPSAAQTTDATSRGYLSINGGFQPTSTDFSDTVALTEFLEQGQFVADYPQGQGVSFDVGGGARVWRQLSIGATVSFFSKTEDAQVRGNIPHPFFFDRPRSITGTRTDLGRQETVTHLHASWTMPVNETLAVSLFGGPSFFQLTQDLLTAVQFDQSYPYDTAQYAGATVAEQSESAAGFNLGLDVTYYLSERVGIGWLVRFSRATIDLPSDGGGTVAADAGGLQTTGGLRIRF